MEDLISKVKQNKQIDFVLTDRHRSDLELLLNGGFFPLDTFNNENDYNLILDKMELSDDDYLIISDVDEIANKKKLIELKKK